MRSKKNLQADTTKYHLAKFMSILLSVLAIPISTYCGYLLGVEKYWLAFTVLGIEGVLCIIDLKIYWWMMEYLNGKK